MPNPPILPVVAVGTGAYLLWFSIHYFGRGGWPTAPIKSVLTGGGVPDAGSQPQTTTLTADITAEEQNVDAWSAGADQGGSTTSTTGTANAAGLTNPIGPGLTAERTDQGVDFGGTGPLYAMGDGTVTNVFNSGWPNGVFICIHLDEGRYVYYAEDITPMTTKGAKVKAGQTIGYATGGQSGIEIGWAAPPGTGDSLAASRGEVTGNPTHANTPTGQDFRNTLKQLGANV